jgi:hypothetical protein
MKAIDFAVSRILPEDMRQPTYDLSKKGVGVIMADVASRYPEKFGEVAKRLGDLGRMSAWFHGYSTTEDDTAPVIDTSRYYKQMDAELKDLKKEKLDGEEFDSRRNEILLKYSDVIEKDTMREAMNRNNAFALAVASGARGNAAHVKAILSTPGVYTDTQGKVIPLFVKHSFAEGVRPAETLAGTYGARLSVTCLGEGTEVRMVDGGIKPIEKIIVGDWVVGANVRGECFPVRVTSVFDQGVQPVSRFTFRSGNAKQQFVEVICTHEHKFLFNDACTYQAAASKYRRGNGPKPDPALQHAKSVYPIGVNRSKKSVVMAGGCAPAEAVNEPFALLLGLMAGDGCFVDHQRNMRLSCADLTLVQDIEPYLDGLGLKATKTSDGNHDITITTADYNARLNTSIQPGTQGFVAGRRLPFRQSVIDHKLADYSYNKDLPAQMWGWDMESVGAFLAGLLATDGCLYFEGRRQAPHLSFYMTAERLIRGLSELLHVRLGVRPTKIHTVTKGGFGDSQSPRKNPLYGFTISASCDVAKILSVIADVPGVKSTLVDRARKFQTTQNNPYPKSRLVAEEPLGSQHCYDIEVDHEDHLFVLANGMVTSNSTKRATAKGGDLAKILNQSTSNYNVTEKDCGADNGIDLDPQDSSLSGRVLAAPYGDLPAGSVIDKRVMAQIRKSDKPVLVRSAMTCRAKHGLCAHCVGVQADGKFPRVGASVGITAAQSISEPIVQGALNTKHNCLYINDLQILGADGRLLSFDDLAVGDEVIGVGEVGREVTRVTAKIDQGMQEVYRYDFAAPRGRLARFSISASSEHQVWTSSGKVPIGKVDHILIPRAYDVRGGKSEPLAFFAGFFMGDGIRLAPGNKQSLKISCAEPDTAAELDVYLRERGMCLKKRKRSHDWAVVTLGKDKSARDPQTGRIVSSQKHPGKALIARLGWEGCYALDKSVPDEVWTWDDESVRAFVSGFVTADGSVFETATGAVGVAMSSTSLPMLERLQQLLWSRLGVMTPCISVIGKVVEGGIRRNCQHQFLVRETNEVALLLEQITPMGPKRTKVESFRDRLPSPNQKPLVARLLSVTPMGLLPCVDISVAADNELFSLSNGAVVKNSGMAKGKRSFSGFDYVSQFVQIPDDFKDRAAVSEKEGMVENIEDAPQGGKFIYVGGHQHFALPGYEPTVKVGETVEAGDQLSEGLVSPADIVRLRGLGEGRRYYADRLGQILADSGNPPDRRNMEIIARSTVDNYLIDDPDADSPWNPDELVRENDFLSDYLPPADTSVVSPSKAVGTYLQKPALHYTVGTKLTKKMADRLDKTGVTQVAASRTAPWFTPEMKRLRVAAHDSKDWLTSLGTSYLSSQMRQALERGDETNVKENYHFGPRLAYGADVGSGGFGENIESTGKF